MAQKSVFDALIAKAARRGYIYKKNVDPILTGKNGNIVFKTHYRTIFQPSFLNALLGNKIVDCLDFYDGKPTGEMLPRYHAAFREMCDIICDEEDQSDLLLYLDSLPTADEFEEERSLQEQSGEGR